MQQKKCKKIELLVVEPLVHARAGHFVVEEVALVCDARRPRVLAASGHHAHVKLALFRRYIMQYE